MKASGLKRSSKVSYKLRINGSWTPCLRFVGETHTAYVFKPCEPTKPILMFETEECYFIDKPLKADTRRLRGLTR